MLKEIAVSAFFMAFELFILQRWLRRREEQSNSIAWIPFKKMMLDAVVRHAEDLLAIANEFESEAETLLNAIRNKGQLDDQSKEVVVSQIDSALMRIDKSRKSFFNIVQTVAPSLQPYAAQYCNEVLWFGDAFQKSLNKARGYIAEITEDMMGDKEKTSHQLNGVSAMLASIKMFRDIRFSGFKSNFTQSVWKKESLYYHEPDGEFLSAEDYASALDATKAAAELKQIPRTLPIKSFFDKR